MQSNTPFFDQLPNEITQKILKKAARSASDEIAIAQVSPSFDEALATISEECGYYSRGRLGMSSTFFKLLKLARQKIAKHLRAKTLRPPKKNMIEQSCEPTNNKLPVYHSLIISDADLDKPFPCDASQVRTLLFNLTYKQYDEERLNKFARVVKFFTINKFPNLKSLVLNNVNCNNDLLKCFQEYKLDYFYLRYSSLYEYIDKNSVNYEKHLKNFKTLSVQEFQMDTSSRHIYRNIKLDIPPEMKILTLYIDPVGSSPNDDPNEASILFDAKESENLLIVRLLCDPSFRGRISFCPPLGACIEEFDCPVQRDQIRFFVMMDSIWGHNVVKLRIYSYVMEDTCTTFPKYIHEYFTGMPSYIVPDTDADLWKLR